MHSSSNKCGKNHISKRSPPPKVNHGSVKRQLDREVQELPQPRRLWIEKERSKGVEEELENDPDGFCDYIGHCMGFSVARDVHVDAINSLVAMVLEMVLLEGDRHRNTDG